tara:strand:- start:272 stop:631 length:360 start_codon:yes stop_codon:yes gene_type:complete
VVDYVHIRHVLSLLQLTDASEGCASASLSGPIDKATSNKHLIGLDDREISNNNRDSLAGHNIHMFEKGVNKNPPLVWNTLARLPCTFSVLCPEESQPYTGANSTPTPGWESLPPLTHNT